MKQLKGDIGKRGDHKDDSSPEDHSELRMGLERLKKKVLNPMQMCQKLIKHEVPAPSSASWDYDLVLDQCKTLNIH